MAVKKYYVTVDVFGTIRWFKDAKCKVFHRENGPAIEWLNGDIEWWQNDQLHRIDGPAIECADGTKRWYQRSQRHRIDGPAVVYADGAMCWWINGVELSKFEFEQAVGSHDN